MPREIKSFDELYKVVIGDEPPKKADSVKPSSKVKSDLLTDPSKGRNSYGSGQKKKASKSSGYNKKRKQKQAIDKRKKDAESQKRKRAQELRQYKERIAEKTVAVKEGGFTDNLIQMSEKRNAEVVVFLWSSGRCSRIA